MSSSPNFFGDGNGAPQKNIFSGDGGDGTITRKNIFSVMVPSPKKKKFLVMAPSPEKIFFP
jgi:hypothetical protein